MKRVCELVEGEVYHVMNKSIAGFRIFNSEFEYLRFQRMIKFFSYDKLPCKFSQFIQRKEIDAAGFDECFKDLIDGSKKLVQPIAYCVMPTHFHIVAKQISKNGLSIFLGNLLNSYARYFNLKNRRKGPLWQGKFHNVLVENDEQLQHLTRYVHLNPVSAGLVKRPQEWVASSYREYVSSTKSPKNICAWNDLLDMAPKQYGKFVEEHANDQKALAILKKHLLYTPGV